MSTFFGKRMYGNTDVRSHMAGVTITVRKERFVSNEGAENIPLLISTAMTKAVAWLDHAIDQVTVPNYLAGGRLPRAYLQVYRTAIAQPAARPGLAPPADRERLAQQKKFEGDVKAEIGGVLENLLKIRAGLKKSQVIKVNDDSYQEGGETRHFLGLVKQATVQGVHTKGHITIGYRAFREGANLTRILIHEAAHKYTAAKDGTLGSGGYWSANFSDYKDPVGMVTVVCKNNADSHALFVWALNHGVPDVPPISDHFEAELARRWALHTA